jgi:plasmid stability protein
MGQLIVRGLDDSLIQALKRRAARAGRAAEAEHRAILEQVLRPETESFAEAAVRLRARTPPQTTSSADLIRRDRDRDHAARMDK